MTIVEKLVEKANKTKRKQFKPSDLWKQMAISHSVCANTWSWNYGNVNVRTYALKGLVYLQVKIVNQPYCRHSFRHFQTDVDQTILWGFKKWQRNYSIFLRKCFSDNSTLHCFWTCNEGNVVVLKKNERKILKDEDGILPCWISEFWACWLEPPSEHFVDLYTDDR